jgi:hypothetical protein
MICQHVIKEKIMEKVNLYFELYKREKKVISLLSSFQGLPYGGIYNITQKNAQETRVWPSANRR